MDYDLIIIGGGPAGITAGIYGGRLGLKTLLLTKEFGGQLMRKSVKIENYPGFKKVSGQELIKRFISHLKSYPVEIKQEEVVKIKKEKEKFIVFTRNFKRYFSKSIVIASGAEPKRLKVKGERKFLGRGVSYCPVCDGPFFKNKKVAVVGGGNAGFEAGLALKKWAKKVYILEFLDKVSADFKNQALVEKSKKIKVITSVQIKEIKGEKFVNKIIYLDRKTNEKKELEVKGVFIEIGSVPSTAFAKDLIEMNEKNEIKVSQESYQTKTKGVFAAGDCNEGAWKQIITACGEGAKAALSAYKFLKKNEN